MSALSRFPSGSVPARRPLNDHNPNTPTRQLAQVEKAFVATSRSAMKAKLLQPPLSAKKKPKGLTVSVLKHPMIKRVHDENDIMSPPLAATQMFREKSQEREQSKPLPPRNFTDISDESRATSRSSSPSPGPGVYGRLVLPSAVLSPDESRPDFNEVSTNSIFDRLDRIEKELSADSDDESPSAISAAAPADDIERFVVPLAPPSAEMREYAYKLLTSPSPPKLSKPSPLKISQATPTPVKLAMDCDDVNLGSPTESTSPLGEGVDRILAEGLTQKESQRNGKVLFSANTAVVGRGSILAMVVVGISVALGFMRTFW
ncbi:hypothetical protein TrVE_jg2510 [Triparma verrucosa]|uniref:Uncharacterized protein n=1 Tax=Triparma verrucosa TaxID=1606542 RepID=A0A9W7F4M1_9STRA|nr:hypothetical protein TrVE_jg2510 [Triparma verrucosa]